MSEYQNVSSEDMARDMKIEITESMSETLKKFGLSVLVLTVEEMDSVREALELQDPESDDNYMLINHSPELLRKFGCDTSVIEAAVLYQRELLEQGIEIQKIGDAKVCNCLGMLEEFPGKEMYWVCDIHGGMRTEWLRAAQKTEDWRKTLDEFVGQRRIPRW